MLRSIMEKFAVIVLLHIGFGFWDVCFGLPIDFTSVGTGQLNAIWLTSSLLLAVGFLIGIVSLIIGCICCRNGRGFQENEAKPVEEFSNSHGCLSTPVVDGFINPTASSEITIFPPFGINSEASSRSSVVHFEPLPNIKPQAPNLRPAAFSYSEQEISSQDWFYNPYNNFPRNKLKYLQEYGKGWFGRVVEGEAQNILPNEKFTKVIVKILHEDATPTDQMYFLHEVKFYRDLKHPNILGLMGRCLETEPFLILLESCPNGDLKTFLTQNMATSQALVEQGVTLRMCHNITSGLQYMHKNKFIHTDLAARNCLVSPDLSVKIGDYGNSIEVFKSDYYCAGSVALPVRWCAPETLKCTDVTIETREVTPLANIWTLAVVFWEICEFCKLPYEELNDDQVIVRVLGEKNYFLQMPKMLCLYKDELYHLMKLCWSPPLQRPTASQIAAILENLLSSKSGNDENFDPRRLSQDFEQRWQNSKPNCIPKMDNAANVDEATMNTSMTKFKGSKVADSSYLDSPLGIFMLNKSKSQDTPRSGLKFEKIEKANSPVQLSDSDCVENKSSGYETEEGIFDGIKKSDSVINLTGSLDRLNTVAQELQANEFKGQFILNAEMKPEFDSKGANPEIDSWLKGVEVNNEEDETFVRKISEAIRDLDAALAMEKTSSSEENSGKSSHQNSPGKETKDGEDAVVLDFQLGGNTTSFRNLIPKSFELSSLQNSEEPQSLNFTNTVPDKRRIFSGSSQFENYDTKNSLKLKNTLFEESLKTNDSFLNVHSRNSSDTEDEIWRKRIERGEFSEKVKEKSKSIANLMILTHIDASDESDIDLDRSFDRSFTRSSYSRRHYSNARTSLSSNNFGSENDLSNAVLEDNFTESLKKLSNDHKEYGRFDSLGMILPTNLDRENVWGNIIKKSTSEENLMSDMCSIPIESSLPTKVEYVTDPSEVLGENDVFENNLKSGDNFLGNTASKKLGNDLLDSGKYKQNSASLDSFNKIDIKVDSSSEVNGKLDVCDNFEKESECENIVLNGSSPSILLNDGAKIDNLTADKLNRIPSNEESPVVEDILDEDTILVNEDSTSEIVPTFFGAVNQPEALPNIVKEQRNSICEVGEQDAFKEKNVIPCIEITEEAETIFEADVENIGEMECETKRVRPFRFVLKDEISETVDVNHSIQDIDQKCLDLKNIGLMNKISNNFDPNKKVEVIIGACEDFTLDYFKGLKTTFGKVEEYPNPQEVTINKELNLDIWDKHLEKSITQILDNTNFDDINFFASSLESSGKDGYSDTQFMVSDNSVSTSPNTSLSNVEGEEKEKKNEDSRGFTNLNGNASEEEYESNKLRTPDDERSSDSGFRDKGSLSESVEDACEGKYNLEDIEAELEEAYVKGAFSNCEIEKEKSPTEEKGRFEFEEVKFYEDENKNEDDFSDIDGEIEFWQNQGTSDYYPEISEFNPVDSRGWYLHPPDENFFIPNDTVNEEFVSALRDELLQKLPVQSRSFREFSEDYDRNYYEKPEEDKKYVTNFSAPLSPILEEQDQGSEQIYFPSNENAQKNRKSFVNSTETGKSVDTTEFIHYLHHMVETEGKDKGVEKILTQKEDSRFGKEEKAEGVIRVNVETNRAEFLDQSQRRMKGELERDDLLDEGSPEDEGLIFSPDRSLSDPSQSSNGSRAVDISSDLTISSPDILSECYLTPTSEKSPNLSPQHGKCVLSEEMVDECVDKFVSFDSSENIDSNANYHGFNARTETEYVSKPEEAYEMSTSFMGEVSDEEGEAEVGDDMVQNNGPNDWESLSSGGEEEVSSSSGEFIWKDGDKESRVKVKRVCDSGVEELLFEEVQPERKEKHVGHEPGRDENAGSASNEGENIYGVGNGEEINEYFSESEDDRDCSSTGSSASITDFVPSAWNSKAMPSRPALRSPDKKSENQKRNVWFKKQKYHCIYEYPREPSDTESANSSPQKQFTYGIESSGVSNRYFNYGINSKMNLTNRYFTYGLSDLIDYSNYVDWEAVEGVESGVISGDVEPGKNGKLIGNSSESEDHNFYNLNSFDCDFNEPGMTNDEFFVSSSARPFQGSSSQFFPLRGCFPVFKSTDRTDISQEVVLDGDCRDFITPDSGVEDVANTTPQKKSEDDKMVGKSQGNDGSSNVYGNIKTTFINKSGEYENRTVSDCEGTSNFKILSIPGSIAPSSPVALGELRHARDKLKLDLPTNHNIDLNMTIGKNKVEELSQH